MNQFHIYYFTGIGTELSSLSQGVVKYREAGGEIKVIARTGTQLFDQSRINQAVKQAMTTDVVFVSLHGGKMGNPAFDRLISVLEEKRKAGEKTPYIHIQASGGDEESFLLASEHSDGFGIDTWKRISSYHRSGGPVNLMRMLQFLYHFFAKDNVDVPTAQPLALEGVYHPDLQEPADIGVYRKEHIDPKNPTVGLWFYQSYWVNNNIAHIDALIREIERQGANALPVFSLRFKDKELGNLGADEVIEKFFMRNGKACIDVLINVTSMSMTIINPEYEKILPRLGVPFLQAMSSSNPYAVWKESLQGMATMDVTHQAAQPEFDGALITVPVATREEDTTDPVTGALLPRHAPIPERIERIVSLALNWAKLRAMPNPEKKIAIIFHHYPPRNDRIGCAAGLDSFASVKHLLDRMKEEGYVVDKTYENGDSLAKEMLDRMTCDQRWLTPGKMAERSEASASRDVFMPWHDALPDSVRAKMIENWGKMPGELFVHKDRIHFPGLINGNVFITIQPPRGYLENPEAILHDLYLSPPHHYLAYYRWIKHVFKADAVMHVGKHGSLEWLPGKALGLSSECYPDLSIMDIPNVYPYIINDPSEGTQAKRRSYCCIIDHLTPAFTNSDLYDDMAEVEHLLADYNDAKRQDPGKVPVVVSMLWDAVVKADLHHDLELTEEKAKSDVDAFVGRLHSYLSEISDTMISDGLHIMGIAPEGDRLSEFATQMVRLSNGETPSLREAVVSAMGYDYDDLIKHRGDHMPGYKGATGGELIAQAHQKALTLIKKLSDHDFEANAVSDIVKEEMGREYSRVEAALSYVAQKLVPNIRLVTEEIDASMAAFNGKFVLPGPSGAPTRGQADILPTGRNFYSLDPRTIPSKAAWDVGVKLGDALLESYLKETGKHPESIGIIVWGGPTMRSKGDDIAEILYLMGLRPVWQKTSGIVMGLEIIPLSELKRPRIDVVPRISGFFRDAFPNLVELIDEAARMVAALEESPDMNFLRRNVIKDVEEYRKDGKTQDEAWRLATLRVYGCPPGTYGAGVAELVESKHWEKPEDLGNNYIRYSAHAYGQKIYGTQQPKAFRRLLSRMDLTVKNEDSREYDMMSCVDFYNYYGGLIAAVKSVRGVLPKAMVGDSSDPKRLVLRSTFEEAKHVLRSRLLNPKWIQGLKRHGYKGAGDISSVLDVIIGWDATAEVMEDWMYDRVANTYALDPEMRKWLKEVNPYALQNIIDKLLETISRGMWNASDEMEEKLQEAFLDVEGEIEEVVG